MLNQIDALRYIRILCLTFIFFAVTGFAARPQVLPKRIQAEYVVSKDGKQFAKVHELYVVTGNTYKVESITKGIGIYALLGVRKLTSTGKVTPQGLKPIHFELHQGNNQNKNLIADFNWAKYSLRMLVKGEPHDEVITAGTQDLASFAYQFMFLPKPFKNDLTVTLTTGKKLNQYKYKIQPGLESLKVAGGQYKTVHLVPSDQNKDQVGTKEFWLATEKNCILARFLMIDEDGAKLEQTLTELHVD